MIPELWLKHLLHRFPQYTPRKPLNILPHTRPITVPWARSLFRRTESRRPSSFWILTHPLAPTICILSYSSIVLLVWPTLFISSFSRAYSEGHLPSSWKSSLVIPIFKKGERFDALNYRPISTTSVCSKTFERLLCEDLTNYLESNNILSPHQFGFRAHRSTMDQLLMVYDSVSKSMDRGGVTDLILFDFSKAFDVVAHSLLLEKLRCLGIQGRTLSAIRSFPHRSFNESMYSKSHQSTTACT